MQPKKSKSESCIFLKKYDKGKSELKMSVHVDDVFMDGNPETLNNTKRNMKEKFNIQDSVKMKNFLRVYYEWVC